MSRLQQLRRQWANFIEQRLPQLASQPHLVQPQLAVLGLLTGLLTGAVILAFRAVIEWPLQELLQGNAEHFEVLAPWMRMTLPLLGATILSVMLWRHTPDQLRVGVVHVMERLIRHQGQMPLANAFTQFMAGTVALLTGHSGGREGPAIHLGATAASQMGQLLQLPNNSIRTLIACGSAAAIAASFNTPMAGVLFAMEVVMMEYTVTSFIPVIVASVSATLLSHAAYGNTPAFLVPENLSMNGLADVPFVVIEGLIIGACAVLFVRTASYFARFAAQPLYQRLFAAALITGVLALAVPSIMCIVYDSLESALRGELLLITLVLLAAAKLIASAATTGLGVPVGLIGPTLVIGGAVGGVIGIIGTMIMPEQASPVGLYVALGIAAMMGEVLQAPLAALVAILELTANPAIILPAMAVIVVASLTASEVFKTQSIFLASLDRLGLRYPTDPVTQHLQRVGVSSVMTRSFARMEIEITRQQALQQIEANPTWLVINRDGGGEVLLRCSDLRTHLEQLAEQDAVVEPKEQLSSQNGDSDLQVPDDSRPSISSSQVNSGQHAGQPPIDEHREKTTEEDAEPKTAEDPDTKTATVNLLEIPGLRLDSTRLNERATLHEALQALNERNVEALCIERTTAPMIKPVIGVLSRNQIDDYLRLGSL